MNKIWISGDAHFFHTKLLEYVPTRPEDYIKRIIENHNSVVSKDDIWICTGDLSAGLGKIENAKEKLKSIIQFLNGTQKILIKGNHDHFPDEFYKECGFNMVVNYLERNGDIFCHYALEDNEYTSDIEKNLKNILNKFKIKRLFHGHTHCRKVQLNDGIERINTCLDANNYFPLQYI